MWLLFLFTVTGLLVKCWIVKRIWFLRQSPVAAFVLVIAVISSLHSLLDIYNYYRVLFPQNADMMVFLRVYHALVIFIFIFSFVLAIAVVKGKLLWGSILPAIFLSAFLFGWFVFTDDFVVGAKLLPQSYTRVPGDYYWVFQLLTLIVLLVNIMVPCWLYYSSTIEIERVRSANILLGVSLISLTLGGVVLLMKLGVPINAAGVLSLALSIYLLILAECFRDNATRDLRVYIPWTRKARLMRRLTKCFTVINAEGVDSREKVKEYELHFLELAEKHHISQVQAASWLGISQAKYSRDIATLREKYQKE